MRDRHRRASAMNGQAECPVCFLRILWFPVNQKISADRKGGKAEPDGFVPRLRSYRIHVFGKQSLPRRCVPKQEFGNENRAVNILDGIVKKVEMLHRW